MDIGNKHYRDVERAIENLEQKENLSNAETKLKLEELEFQKDGSVRSIADYIGKIIGHFIFISRK